MSEGAIRMVKKAYSEIEPWTGTLLSLKTPNYTDNPNTVGAGDGVETAEDWTRARRHGAASRGTDGTQLDSDENYVRYIFGIESINLMGALSLAKVFDFSKYSSIFEIGCGDMAQALVIHRLCPHIRYVATDLDPFVIERCSQLPILAGIEKGVLDVLSVPDHQYPFAGFDLLTSWGMEYALDDAQLLRLLRMVERAGIPYLLCSATTMGLLQYARLWLNDRRRRTLVAQRRLRMTGWRRSVGKFRSLSRQAGLEMQTLGLFGYHFCVLLKRP